MDFETEYAEILQNIELEIISYYRQEPELIDLEIHTAIEWVARIYGGEAAGKILAPHAIRGLSAEVANRVKEKCDLLKQLSIDGTISTSATPLEITNCLKRILTSVNFWNKKNGRQGYLEYIAKFLSN
jgi:hypothetical protein